MRNNNGKDDKVRTHIVLLLSRVKSSKSAADMIKGIPDSDRELIISEAAGRRSGVQSAKHYEMLTKALEYVKSHEKKAYVALAPRRNPGEPRDEYKARIANL